MDTIHEYIGKQWPTYANKATKVIEEGHMKRPRSWREWSIEQHKMEDYVSIVLVKGQKTVVKVFIYMTKSVEQKVTVWTVHTCKLDKKYRKTKKK